MTKILVTGAAGFIGQSLCKSLLELDHKVVALDNFSTGSLENVEKFIGSDNFEVIEHDVIRYIDLNVDGIINLACPASPLQYQKSPIDTLKASVLGSINLLDLAVKKGVPILQASTSEVYGDPKVSPQDENYWGNVNPIGIRSCYDEGKRAAETLFFDYSRELNANVRVVRIFNTYGPGMAIDDGRVVSNFIVAALQGNPITIYGDGKQTRSLMYIDDLIKGILKMYFQQTHFGPINLGNPDPVSIEILAREIIELTNSNSEIVYAPSSVDDPQEREPNISLAIENLGWKPTIMRREGLTKTIGYFDSIL
jgi:UDP-glucuronate decarboxylase